MANPITNPMTRTLERSVAKADHLRGHPEYAAGIALAKLLAGQIDEMVQAQDPVVVNQMNMRVLPNFHKILYTLGLTPEGFAKITGSSSRAPAPEDPASVDETEAPPAPEAEGDELDRIIANLDNVHKLGSHP